MVDMRGSQQRPYTPRGTANSQSGRETGNDAESERLKLSGTPFEGVQSAAPLFCITELEATLPAQSLH